MFPSFPGGVHKPVFFFIIYGLVNANHRHVYVVKVHARFYEG